MKAMKTIDEVIAIMDGIDQNCTCCAYQHDCDETECIEKDALHYLRELRDMTDIPMEYFENGGTSQKLRNTSQITCPKCHSEFVILDDPDGDHQQLLKCQALLQEFYRNDPLTWSELQQMEGKPVWFEYDGQSIAILNPLKRWAVVCNVDKGYSMGPEISFCGKGNPFWMYKCDLGVHWQAYRKERE